MTPTTPQSLPMTSRGLGHKQPSHVPVPCPVRLVRGLPPSTAPFHHRHPSPPLRGQRDGHLLGDNQTVCFPLAGHAPHHFKLVSVHVFIRHGDRYPLYVIPKTKRPEIDCTLVANR